MLARVLARGSSTQQTDDENVTRQVECRNVISQRYENCGEKASLPVLLSTRCTAGKHENADRIRYTKHCNLSCNGAKSGRRFLNSQSNFSLEDNLQRRRRIIAQLGPLLNYDKNIVLQHEHADKIR